MEDGQTGPHLLISRRSWIKLGHDEGRGRSSHKHWRQASGTGGSPSNRSPQIDLVHHSECVFQS